MISLWTMLIEELNISLPPIPIPSVVYLLYNNVILPLSDILEKVFPSLLFLSSIPYLILPLYFILAGAFKFLSVTIITPRIKYRLSYFFLLISTAFVLILTNLLGEIYKIGFEDAPFRLVENIIVLAVNVFDYVESLAFYCGFLFGIVWVLRYMSKKGKEEQIVSPKSTINGEKPYSLENNINKETNTIKRSSEIDIEDIKSSDELIEKI